MKYDDDYQQSSSNHINLFEPIEPTKQPKSILKHTNYLNNNKISSSSSSNHHNLTSNLSNSKLNELDNHHHPHHHHHQTNVSNDDLQVRGYSSNLYRDDFNALKIENKNNLIPWNGDHDLLIDRFDCRLYLYDLTPYDSDLLNDEIKNPKYTQEEIDIENMCDQDRYFDLVNEFSNETDPSEDNQSRNKYGTVGFAYDDTKKNSSTSNASSSCSKNGDSNENDNNSSKSNEKLFVPSDNLKLPFGMLIPETVKMNQLIVKTAMFIAKQGLQAEILLKTKQSTNTQFNFLNYDSPLYTYYKHLVQMIRDNKIDPLEFLKEDPQENNEATSSESENDSDNDDEDNYLHPLLSKALNRPASTDDSTTINLNNVNNQSQNPETQTQTETNNQEIKIQSDDKEINSSEIKIEEKSNELVVVGDKDKDEILNDENIEEPNGTTKIMIDKLIEYVLRNGVEFEMNLRKKNDERFDFLNEDNKYNKYYRRQMNNSKIKKIEDKKNENVNEKREIDKRKSESSSTKSRSHKKSRKSEKESSGEDSDSSTTSSSSSNSDTSSDSSHHKEKEKKQREKRKHKKEKKSRHKESSSSSSSRRHKSKSETSKKKHRKRSSRERHH